MRNGVPRTASGTNAHPSVIASEAIAVGTLIAERPPHRTVRAAFPHTAPTLGVTANRCSLAALRMRSSACDTLTRY